MKTKLLILILSLTLNTVFGQRKLADKFFDDYGYLKAIELYQKAFENGDDSAHVLTRLGDSYYNNSNSEKAAYWYGKALAKSNVSAEQMFKYIQSLKSIGKFSEANDWTVEFNKMQTNGSKLDEYDANNLAKYDALTKPNKALSITIENLPINSEFSDFGSFIYDNELYFASAQGENKSKEYGWNDEPYLDLFQVSVTEKNYNLEFGPIDFIKSDKINSKYHEANVTISNDGKTIYFTRDNVTRRNKLDFDKKGTTHLKIYKAKRTNNVWEEIKELPFNDEVYSTGHPSLSADNKTLFFVSDREGGFGQTDIYKVDILENNKYGEVINLGPKVNTIGREMFPFVSKDSILYFSSDGHLNLGLLDIFKSNVIKDSIAITENLGAPYNSAYDDFAYFVDPSNENKRSFLSSNRPNGKGGDDIYTAFSRICAQKIKGFTKDKNTNEILSNSTVKLIDETGKIIEETTTGKDGAYEFNLDCSKPYVIIGEKSAYIKHEINIATNIFNESITEQDLLLESYVQGNQIVINPIFFDYSKWDIRTDAEYELENIVDVLRANPNMIIKIESHTDSRGRDKYNLKLSDKRANATKDYMISRGIEKERIESAIGYGESKLLNKCSNGVRCSQEEHQINRRSYFYIIKK